MISCRELLLRLAFPLAMAIGIALPGNVHGHEPEFKVLSLVIERMEYMLETV